MHSRNARQHDVTRVRHQGQNGHRGHDGRSQLAFRLTPAEFRDVPPEGRAMTTLHRYDSQPNFPPAKTRPQESLPDTSRLSWPPAQTGPPRQHDAEIKRCRRQPVVTGGIEENAGQSVAEMITPNSTVQPPIANISRRRPSDVVSFTPGH